MKRVNFIVRKRTCEKKKYTKTNPMKTLINYSMNEILTNNHDFNF